MQDFDATLYERKGYTKGELYLIKGFDFQKDIPNRKGTQRDTFSGIRSLLSYLTEKGLQIYITNKELNRDYEMVGDGKFLVDIKKFVGYCNVMSSKASPQLAQGFFTHDINVKNIKFTEEQEVEIASNFSDVALISSITIKPSENKLTIIRQIIASLLPVDQEKLTLISNSIKDPNMENLLEKAKKLNSADNQQIK